MKPDPNCHRPAWILVLTALLWCAGADALTETGRVGSVEATVYAPDWTWQKRDINILVALENNGASNIAVTLALQLPAGKEDHFTFEGDTELTVTLASGEHARCAFTNITANDGVPCQVYPFALTATSLTTGAILEIPYPVRTIRGAVVNTSTWAILVPVAIAAAWCIVFAVVVSRFGAHGAWRTPGPPVDMPESEET